MKLTRVAIVTLLAVAACSSGDKKQTLSDGEVQLKISTTALSPDDYRKKQEAFAAASQRTSRVGEKR